MKLKIDHRKCPVCGQKMIKKGKRKSGKQKWYCKHCRKYHSFKRKDLTEKADLKMYCDYVLKGHNHEFYDMPKSKFFRKIKKFRSLTIRSPKISPIPENYLHLDGIYKNRDYCHLIVKSKDGIIAFKECKTENSEHWGSVLVNIPPPNYVIIDGQKGMNKAIKLYWPDTKIQICLFHVKSTVKHKLTSRPKLEAGKELKFIADAIINVKTKSQAEKWWIVFNDFLQQYKDFINEKVKSEGKRPWYKHRSLRSCIRYLKRLYEKGQLFLYTEVTDFILPRTNNKMEGGTNSVIKRKSRLHPGMNRDNLRQLIKIVLMSQTKTYNSDRLGDIFDT